jgi:hypothetical protein
MALSIQGALGGTVNYNTVAWAEYGFPCDIRIWDSDSVALEYNAGDNNGGGVIDVGGGGNTNLTIANNVFVDGDSGAQETVYADPFSYPQTLAGFAPVADEAVDTGDAGALTTGAEFRGLAYAFSGFTATDGESEFDINFDAAVSYTLGNGPSVRLWRSTENDRQSATVFGAPITIPASASGITALTCGLSTGTLDADLFYWVSLDTSGSDMDRDSDSAPVASFEDEPVTVTGGASAPSAKKTSSRIFAARKFFKR